jgi:hypothetical protein
MLGMDSNDSGLDWTQVAQDSFMYTGFVKVRHFLIANGLLVSRDGFYFMELVTELTVILDHYHC